MVETHRRPPVAHGAAGVRLGDTRERLASLLEPEGVQRGDPALELLLCCGIAGDGEVDGPELFGTPNRRLMPLMRYGCGSQAKKDKSTGQDLRKSHSDSPFALSFEGGPIRITIILGTAPWPLASLWCQSLR